MNNPDYEHTLSRIIKTLFGPCRLEHISVIFASRGGCGEQPVYLAAQHKDGVDVREDAVKAEVDVWTDQRKN